MSIIVPNPHRSRALFIIDIQHGFTKPDHAHIVPNVVRLIKNGGYDRFVLVDFRANKGSLWDKQMGWTFELKPTPTEILDVLDHSLTTKFIKTTKSTFMMKPYLAAELRSWGIEEIHVVGYDINDCVLATANDAFDLGFFTYVIEEASESSESDALRDAALAILRENEMTNHSELIADKKEI